MTDPLAPDLEAILGTLSEDDVMYDHPVSSMAGPMDPVLFVRWDALRAALRERDARLVCGAVFDAGSKTVGFRPEDMGCGKPIEKVADLFRCAQCATPFHQGCIRTHFGWPEAGGSLMPHALDAGLAALSRERNTRLPDDPASLDLMLITQAPLLRDAYVAYVVERVSGERDARLVTLEAAASELAHRRHDVAHNGDILRMGTFEEGALCADIRALLSTPKAPVGSGEAER